MSNPTAIFASILLEQFGERAYAVALEQVRQSVEAGAKEIAVTWVEIANVIAARPQTIVLMELSP